VVNAPFSVCEREVRANLVHRIFTRIEAGEVPDAKTILIARALGPEVIERCAAVATMASTACTDGSASA